MSRADVQAVNDTAPEWLMIARLARQQRLDAERAKRRDLDDRRRTEQMMNEIARAPMSTEEAAEMLGVSAEVVAAARQIGAKWNLADVAKTLKSRPDWLVSSDQQATLLASRAEEIARREIERTARSKRKSASNARRASKQLSSRAVFARHFNIPIDEFCSAIGKVRVPNPTTGSLAAWTRDPPRVLRPLIAKYQAGDLG